MREFDFLLDPAETLTIRRLLTPRRIPNKGRAVYRFDSWLQPVLKENGFELIGHHQRKSSKAFFRSPGGVVAESFVIHAAVPSDEAILRLASAMAHFGNSLPKSSAPFYFDGSLGYFRARFYRLGCQNWGEVCNMDFPGAEEFRRRDRVPTFQIGLAGLWHVDLFWLDGYDRPPTWDHHLTRSSGLESLIL